MNIHMLVIGFHGKGKRAVFIDKFDCVFRQVIKHLLHQILIDHGDRTRTLVESLDIQRFRVDLVLKQQNCFDQQMRNIRTLKARCHRTFLKPGDIQHGMHKARHAVNLRGNDAQIFLLLSLRNGAVQNAVHKAADACDRCFQLMGHIGNKASAAALIPVDEVRHAVHGRGQLIHFRIAGLLKPLGKIALCIKLRGLCHLRDRAQHTRGVQIEDHRADRTDHDQGNRQQHDELGRKLAQIAHRENHHHVICRRLLRLRTARRCNTLDPCGGRLHVIAGCAAELIIRRLIRFSAQCRRQ